MTIKEQIEVMQAYARAEKIQFKPITSSEWYICTAPVWNWDEYEYRIRPKELTLEVRWFCRPCHDAWHRVNEPIEHIDKDNK